MAPIELLVVDDNAAETLLLLYALEQCDPGRVPVVMFSVTSDQADAQRAVELGAREFVHKPSDLETYKGGVLQMIEKWVPDKGRKRARA